jgi:nitrogen regulatory protein PII
MVCRGAEYVANFVEKVILEIIVADGVAGKIIELISSIAKTVSVVKTI